MTRSGRGSQPWVITGNVASRAERRHIRHVEGSLHSTDQSHCTDQAVIDSQQRHAAAEGEARGHVEAPPICRLVLAVAAAVEVHQTNAPTAFAAPLWVGPGGRTSRGAAMGSDDTSEIM